MAGAVQGEVIRFDQVKGYGFISPRGGGEDVFLHVNDLLDDKHLIRPGAIVEFLIESGDRGLKASSVHLVSPAPVPAAATLSGGFVAAAPRHDPVEPARGEAPRHPASDDPDDDLVDVLPASDFEREVTEVLLRVEPALTGSQVLVARRALATLGTKYGWIGG